MYGPNSETVKIFLNNSDPLGCQRVKSFINTTLNVLTEHKLSSEDFSPCMQRAVKTLSVFSGELYCHHSSAGLGWSWYYFSIYTR